MTMRTQTAIPVIEQQQIAAECARRAFANLTIWDDLVEATKMQRKAAFAAALARYYMGIQAEYPVDPDR